MVEQKLKATKEYTEMISRAHTEADKIREAANSLKRKTEEDAIANKIK